MTFDYDKFYGETPDALGAPTKVFVDFFERLERTNARVLDVGCGQGRDALFIARSGHDVVGVDLSPNGIRDLQHVADSEKLSIQGIVADIVEFTPEGTFDIILIDRTLHMLAKPERLTVLQKLLNHVHTGGYVLVADEPSNIPDFEAAVGKNAGLWDTIYKHRGYFFIQRQ